MKYWGGIEAGGTKFICTVANSPDNILDITRFPTTSPEETLQRTLDFFTAYKDVGIQAFGIACFGPLNLDPNSPTYGYITSTPKPGWADTNMITPIQKAFDLPVVIDTDVNGAALGEYRWGAAQRLHTFIYLTIGTGIGGGGLVNGELLHGLVHPEMGHIFIPHDKEKDPFPGICPYHGDCFEGLANGPSLQARWGIPAEELPHDHPGWDLEANYIALASVNYILCFSPQRIILGGGVMHHPTLIHMIRKKVVDLLKGYVRHPALEDNIDELIVIPKLADQAGMLGAIALAQTIEE